MKLRVPVAIASCLFLLHFVPSCCQASFHLWKFDEVFSNAAGTIQFIEMINPFDGEEFVGGVQLKSNSNTFTVPSNLPSALTANHHMLFATAGFGSLAGGVTPDYVIPANFFTPAGDTLNWAGGFDIQSFGPIPTDGVTSRTLPGTTNGTNSPANFAGQAGSVNVPEPASMVCLLDGLIILFARRWGSRANRL